MSVVVVNPATQPVPVTGTFSVAPASEDDSAVQTLWDVVQGALPSGSTYGDVTTGTAGARCVVASGRLSLSLTTAASRFRSCLTPLIYMGPDQAGVGTYLLADSRPRHVLIQFICNTALLDITYSLAVAVWESDSVSSTATYNTTDALNSAVEVGATISSLTGKRSPMSTFNLWQNRVYPQNGAGTLMGATSYQASTPLITGHRLYAQFMLISPTPALTQTTLSVDFTITIVQ